MSITVNKKDLFEALQKAFPIIPLKSSLQILSNFKLSFNNNIIEISATDLDHFLRVFSPAQGNETFDVTVNARKLFEIVRELPDGIVFMDISENVLILKSEKGFSCKIAGSDVHDFPGFPDEGTNSSIEILSTVLKDLIVKSSFAAAKDESRAVLCGVLFELSGQSVGMVSTDGHRLGSSFHSIDIKDDTKFDCIISPKSLNSLTRIIETKADSTIQIKIGEKYICFSSEYFTMYSKMLDGPYPDYTKVIPKNNPKSAIIEKNSLQIAVKRVSVLSNQKTHLIKCTFTPNLLEIIVSNRDIGGEARDVIAIDYSNDEHSIGFNSHYLLEILDIIKTEKIKIEMNTQISACLIFPHYENATDMTSEDTFLIMPLRIIDEM